VRPMFYCLPLRVKDGLSQCDEDSGMIQGVLRLWLDVNT
jgi:hypothetical protein